MSFCNKGIKLALTIIVMVFTFQPLFAQFSRNAETAQLNFWIGKWDLFTNGSQFGESHVDTILDGYVIQEDFVEFPPDPFHGINLTTFNPDTNKWEQTMVDNQGHHSFFVGEFKENKMVFIRNFKNKKGENRIQRTMFYNISKNNFDWTFDASSDEGKTWKVFYTVHYVRKK